MSSISVGFWQCGSFIVSVSEGKLTFRWNQFTKEAPRQKRCQVSASWFSDQNHCLEGKTTASASYNIMRELLTFKGNYWHKDKMTENMSVKPRTAGLKLNVKKGHYTPVSCYSIASSWQLLSKQDLCYGGRHFITPLSSNRIISLLFKADLANFTIIDAAIMPEIQLCSG